MNALLRDHPVRQLLDAVAGQRGEKPSRPELDALELTDVQRRAVAGAVDDIALAAGRGEFQNARQLAEHRGASIIDGLDEERQDPGYLDPPEFRSVRDIVAEIPRSF